MYNITSINDNDNDNAPYSPTTRSRRLSRHVIAIEVVTTGMDTVRDSIDTSGEDGPNWRSYTFGSLPISTIQLDETSLASIPSIGAGLGHYGRFNIG
jgi:hypothetical protein